MRGLGEKIIVPVLIALLLLPLFICLIFTTSARVYAERSAERDLASLQEKLIPLLGEAEDTQSFLSRASYIVSHESGNAGLLILSDDLDIIYPRSEEERESVRSLSMQVADYIEEGRELKKSLCTEDHLVNIYMIPRRDIRLSYLITYSPNSRIGPWISSASILVLLSSYLVSALVILVLCLTVRSIRRPIARLAAEAERIGGGDYDPIEGTFKVRELEELRTSMNLMAEEIRVSEEREQKFFQNVSHELRNPLMSISGYAQGIKEGVFKTESAHTILEESLRLTELVESLLTLSRIEERKAEARPVCIKDVVEDSFDRFTGMARRSGISLSAAVDEELAILSDEELLSKVLDNLLSNAMRYAKSIVTVSAGCEGDVCRICVSDDGEGIAEEDLPHLFERCYKGKGGHFGLGLSIAESAAKAMGGTLSAMNSADGGALFTLTLPLT